MAFRPKINSFISTVIVYAFHIFLQQLFIIVNFSTKTAHKL